uniref:class E sortase n=1 Tax=uncultured Nocardioides sp. TaxID=198441 RepID=UPI0034524574
YLFDVLPDMTPSFPRNGVSGLAGAVQLGPLGLVGGLLLLAGLGLGGYVLWQMHGTNIVSERAHRELVLEAEAHWDRQTAIDRTSEQGRGSFTSRYGPVEAVIRIPRFGDDYAVPVLAGTSEHVLSVGYGHFAGTAEAGAVGNYALAAHRVTHGEPLRRMPELEVGDEMVVETARWIYTYRLDTAGDALSVPFTQGWVVGEVPDNPRTGGIEPAQEPGQRLITLTTCAELFQTDDRLIAFGRMVGKQPGH